MDFISLRLASLHARVTEVGNKNFPHRAFNFGQLDTIEVEQQNPKGTASAAPFSFLSAKENHHQTESNKFLRDAPERRPLIQKTHKPFVF